jgi:hypothetical protein
MALFHECIQKCAQKLVDTADIVRDGDITPTVVWDRRNEFRITRIMNKIAAVLL